MADKYTDIASGVLDAVGGPDNVASYTNCITRLRIIPKDASVINDKAVKAVPGVLGTVAGDQYQVILGPGVVTKVADKFGPMVTVSGAVAAPTVNDVYEEDLGLASGGAPSAEQLQARGAQMKAEQKARNDTPVKNFLRHVGNIFVPLIPAFVAAGLIGGIASILQNLMTAGHLHAGFWTQLQLVLGIMQRGMFAYLVIFVGIFAAKEFGGTPALGGVIAGVTLLNGMAAAPVGEPCAEGAACITNIFNGNGLQPGYGGVIGVLLAVWLLCFVEKLLRRVVPDSIDIIVTPTLALLIVGLLTIFIIMPFAGLVSGALVGGINWVLDVGGAVAGFVLGGLFLPLVMLGLHQVLTPIHVEMINAQGMTPLLPMLAMAGAGQVGAALALWIRCRRNTSLTGMIKGALPVGFLGIGEPLIYGVTLPLGRPFITACIGGAFGGATIGLISSISANAIGATAVGPSGIALIPLIAHGMWWGYIIGLVVAYIAGFIITYFFGVPREAMYGDDEVSEGVANAEATGAFQGL